MKELSKEYDELLNVIEKEKKKDKPAKQETKPTEKEKVESKNEVKDKTEELIKNVQSQNEESVSRNKGTGFDVSKFEELMKTRLIDEHKRIQSYERPYISVSEITSCLRKAYYYRKKYHIDLNKSYNFPYLFLINRVGNSVHDVVQELYDFSETEKTVLSDDYGVKGRVDALRGNFLYELKTTDPGKIKNLTANYNQGLIYSYILNNEYDYKIKTITLVYIERNLRNIIVYDYLVDNEKAKKLLENALLLKRSVNKTKVPEPVMADSEQCTFCPYKTYCKKDKSEMSKPFEQESSNKNINYQSETKETETQQEKESSENVKEKAKFILGG